MPYIIVMISEEATGQEIVIDIMETHKFQIELRIFCISRNKKGTKNAIWRKFQIRTILSKTHENNLTFLKINGLEIGSLRCIVKCIATLGTEKKIKKKKNVNRLNKKLPPMQLGF